MSIFSKKKYEKIQGGKKDGKSGKHKIFVVDDEEKNVQSLQGLLGGNYTILSAANGQEALDKIRTMERPEEIALIISDQRMPLMTGTRLFEEVKGIIPDTMRIILTAFKDEDVIIDAVNKAKADRFMLKPFDQKDLVLHVEKVIDVFEGRKKLKEYRLELEDRNKKLKEYQKELEDRNIEIEATQKEVILTLGEILEFRSIEASNHVKRVSEYMCILAKDYGLPENEIKLLKIAAPMHDIGKIAIPDEILNKPGRLSEEEYEKIKEHPTIGYKILCKSSREIFKVAATIAHQHHEKWDGTGYPRGLKGEEIDIAGRIAAIADVFDALTNDRCYRDKWPIDEAVMEIEAGKGKHFDPKLCDLFLRRTREFEEILNKYSKTSESESSYDKTCP